MSAPHIQARITGMPYAKNKVGGDKDAPKRWSAAIVEQTKLLPKVTHACMIRITYFLWRNHVPKDYPFGTDLDNLNKRFLDALSQTIFQEAKGKDSCVIAMEVMKVIMEKKEDCGAALEVLPIKL